MTIGLMLAAALTVGGLPEAQVPTWTSGTYEPGDYKKNPNEIPIKTAGDASKPWSDGDIKTWFPLGKDRLVTWQFKKTHDIESLAIYSSYENLSRDGFSVDELEVRPWGSNDFVPVKGASLDYLDLNKKRQFAKLTDPSGFLAKDVEAVRLRFGKCDADWTAVAEIELSGVENAAGHVVPDAGRMHLRNRYLSPEHLRFPYVATHYVKPVVSTEENVRLGYYVTDWNASKVRFGDDSLRFTVKALCRPEKGGADVVREARDVPSGDGEIDFGRLPAGDYQACLWAVDGKGLESHRVWHEFRVKAPQDIAPSNEKTARPTVAELAKYGIRADGDYGRQITVEIGPRPEKLVGKQVADYVAAKLSDYVAAGKVKAAKRPGYAILIAESEGKPYSNPHWFSKVVYDKGYDKEAVERDAVRTCEGLQKLIDEKAAAGFRRLVLPTGCYRVSATKKIALPGGFTLDLGGATVKLNEFTGAQARMISIDDAVDAHLVNGIVEGDYFEHDYAHSPNNSEWVLGVTMAGACRDSSVENVTIREVSGYGMAVAMGRGDWKRPVGKYVPGGLDPKTGALDANDAARFTTDYLDVADQKAAGRLQVSRYLGYQGLAMRSAQMVACWYDADRRFVFSETLFQYRPVPIPSAAHYLRFSVEAASKTDAELENMHLCRFSYPHNCAIRGCRFELVRAVGLALANMKNMLIEDNEFRRCGYELAMCSIDAEDGWDQMQDVYYHRNRFPEVPVNGLLCCCGHNIMVEENEGPVCLYGRCHSPCVRNNRMTLGAFFNEGRLISGYARFANNTYSKVLKINSEIACPGWDFMMTLNLTDTNEAFAVEMGDLGGLLRSKAKGRKLRVGCARECTFEDCTTEKQHGRWTDCTVARCKFTKLKKAVFVNCRFTDCLFSGFDKERHGFKNCTFERCRFDGIGEATVGFRDCTLTDCRGIGDGKTPPKGMIFDKSQIRGTVKSVYYVSPTGDDAKNSGLKASDPLATVAKALSLAEKGDEIVLAKGTHRLGGAELAVTCELTLRGQTGKREDVILDGEGKCRVLNVKAKSVIRDLTVANGACPEWGSGAGVHLEAGTLHNCVVRDCSCRSSGQGVGICLAGEGTLVEDCLVTDCSGGGMGRGMGVCNRAGLLRRTTITANRGMKESRGYFGLGLCSAGPKAVTEDCTISHHLIEKPYFENIRGWGTASGVWIEDGVVRNSVISDNELKTRGGHYPNGYAATGVIIEKGQLVGCKIISNKTDDSSTATIRQFGGEVSKCTLSGNVNTSTSADKVPEWWRAK